MSGPRAVVLTLARVEGRLLLRRPAFAAGVALSIALLVVLTWSKAPVMHRDDVLIVASLFPLAGATYLAANLAGSRSRRRGTDELYGAVPTTPLTRTTAHLLSLAWPLATAIALAAAEVGYLKMIGGVWAPSASEIATGPMIVLLFGASGVFVSRLMPSPIAGSVGLVGLGAVQFYFMSLEPAMPSMRRWGAFWLNAPDLLPRELLYRPAGWHLIYLAGLAALAIAATRLRHGPGLGRVTAAVSAVALVATGLGGLIRPQNRERQLDAERVAAREPMVCETHDGVRYCAYRAYTPWIPRWRNVVASVAGDVPHALRPGLEVRQWLADPYTSEGHFGPPEEQTNPGLVRMNTYWGIRFRAGAAELALASRAAAWAVGLPAGDAPSAVRWTEESIRTYIADVGGKLPEGHEILKVGDIRYQGPCNTIGQARAIVALWLTGQTSPDAANAIRSNRRWSPRGLQTYAAGEIGLVTKGGDSIALTLGFGNPTYVLDTYPFGAGSHNEWGIDEAYYAMQLLERRPAEVARVLRTHWAALTSPAAKTEDAINLLGLKRLPTVDEQLRALRISPEDAIRRIYAGTEPAKLEAMLARGPDAFRLETPGAPCP